jgi:DNA-binding transcriptional LysR family regulator
MELRHLRYFVELANSLHFGRAAARLGMSQPPLSQQIAALEAELGVKLLDRNSRKVALTAAGELFLQEARTALAGAERAINVAHQIRRGERGSLAIGFNASAPFIPSFAQPVARFRRAHPHIKLELAETPAGQLAAAVENRRLDVGYLRSKTAPDLGEAIHVTLAHVDRLFIAVSANHHLAKHQKVALGDLAGESMLFYYQGETPTGFPREVMDMISAAGLRNVQMDRVRETATLLGLAAVGTGIAIVAHSMCALRLDGLVYRPISDLDAQTAVWLVRRRDNPNSAAAVFERYVQESLAARARREAPVSEDGQAKADADADPAGELKKQDVEKPAAGDVPGGPTRSDQVGGKPLIAPGKSDRSL